MARLYYLSNVNSDLTGGLDFSYALYPNPTSSSRTSTPVTVSIGQGGSEASRAFSEPASPGFKGLTGDYTFTLNISTANTNIDASIQIHRINSAGTVQNSGPGTVGQNFGTTGVKTFSMTGVNLGTWQSGDRLRIDYTFTNAALHQANSFAFLANHIDSRILTPFAVRSFATL